MNNNDFDKNFDAVWKLGKYAVIVSLLVLGWIAGASLVGWIAYHFLSKWW